MKTVKIQTAFVHDETLSGNLQRPFVVVGVNELPDITIEPRQFPGGWTVSKAGPFVMYSNVSDPSVDAGEFNLRFRRHYPAVVDVALQVGSEREMIHGKYSLPVPRARQLLRKYDPTWRLYVSDRDALKGQNVWLPVEANAACRHWLGMRTCGARPTRIARQGSVDVPLCADHMQDFSDQQAASRIANK